MYLTGTMSSIFLWGYGHTCVLGAERLFGVKSAVTYFVCPSKAAREKEKGDLYHTCIVSSNFGFLLAHVGLIT